MLAGVPLQPDGWPDPDHPQYETVLRIGSYLGHLSLLPHLAARSPLPDTLLHLCWRSAHYGEALTLVRGLWERWAPRLSLEDSGRWAAKIDSWILLQWAETQGLDLHREEELYFRLACADGRHWRIPEALAGGVQWEEVLRHPGPGARYAELGQGLPVAPVWLEEHLYLLGAGEGPPGWVGEPGLWWAPETPAPSPDLRGQLIGHLPRRPRRPDS